MFVEEVCLPGCLLLCTCGCGSNWNTWFKLFGWVSKYSWQYSVLCNMLFILLCLFVKLISLFILYCFLYVQHTFAFIHSFIHSFIHLWILECDSDSLYYFSYYLWCLCDNNLLRASSHLQYVYKWYIWFGYNKVEPISSQQDWRLHHPPVWFHWNEKLSFYPWPNSNPEPVLIWFHLQ